MTTLDSMVINPLSDKLKNSNSIEIDPSLLSNRYIIYRIFEIYFHSKGISKASQKSINNILDSLPCKKQFKIKKGFSVISDNYKLNIIESN